MPVRNIPPNHRSLTGAVASSKQGRLVGSESSLERDFFILLDFDLNVARYEEQPVIIRYQNVEGQARSYTPDVLIHYRKDIVPAKLMKPLLCEVKYRDELRRNWPEIKPKIRAGRSYARSHDWRFQVITEREIRTPFLENAKFLRQYRRIQTNWEQSNLLLEAMRELREADPETLLLAIFKDRWNRAELMPMLWQLVSNKMIGADLTQPVTMKSRIWAVL